MVITNLEEKENRKIWVPIRGGNRGGWSLFEWEKVREMPYRDREMYLGNSAKIGVLDKGGKWRKKDWYLHKNHLDSGQTLTQQMSEAMKKDQMRMKSALGLNDSDQEDNKLTPAEMQELLKKVKANKQEGAQPETTATGLGFDKMKVQIRARPTAKGENPHRLDGNADEFEQKYGVKVKKEERNDSRSRSRDERKKKHKKQKRERREYSASEQRHKKKHKHRSGSREHKEKKHKEHKEKKHKHDRHE